MFFFFNKKTRETSSRKTSHVLLPETAVLAQNLRRNFHQSIPPQGSFRPLYGLMGCGSSNATATAPEANVVKQRRRLSVGNVDTSDLVRFSLYFVLGKDIWFDGLWGALGGFGDVHGYYTHTSFFAHIFVWPGWVLNVLPCTFFFGVYSDIHILPASSNLGCNPHWEMEKLMAQLTCCNYWNSYFSYI